MLKLTIILTTLTLVGCNSSQSDAAKYLNKASDVIEACGDRKEAIKQAMTGIAMIESKEKANIPLTEKESEAMGRFFVASINNKCDEKSEYLDDNGNTIKEKSE